MSRLAQELRLAVVLLRHGMVGSLAFRVLKQLWSDTTLIGLRRDLAVPFVAPDARIPLTVRRLDEGDAAVLRNLHAEGLTSAARLEMAQREPYFERFPDPYVAVGPDGEACYVQWLLAPQQNAAIRELRHGYFPPLRDGEALLEGAFTTERARGQGVMAAAMARIAEHAPEVGASVVITFVGEDNVASLKGCARAGFAPYTARRIHLRFFRIRVEAIAIPDVR
jgi:GNAT superfamily N-acetyltransferase